jgi:hypothetical protein
VGAQRTLRLGAGPDGRVRIRERREHRITLGEEGDAIPRPQGMTKYLPVLGEHRAILGAE